MIEVDECSETRAGEAERFEVERERCILLSQPGDRPRGLESSTSNELGVGDGEGEGDS